MWAGVCSQLRAGVERSQTGELEISARHGLKTDELRKDNILLGHDGYLCLTDFGLAERENEGGAWAFLGTSWYMAPELIKNFRYLGGTVDWWASGVLLYEMLSKEIVRQVSYHEASLILTPDSAISRIPR